jgi:hypothetical protein
MTPVKASWGVHDVDKGSAATYCVWKNMDHESEVNVIPHTGQDITQIVTLPDNEEVLILDNAEADRSPSGEGQCGNDSSPGGC